jgi:hypothetical protein
MANDFLRYCEVVIGPLADWQGKGNTGEAVRIYADGSNDHLRVAFTAQKTVTGEPNKAEIAITGLSDQTQRAIRANLTRVQVLAGYSSSSSSASVVCVGGLMAVMTQRQGPDLVTKLVVLDGMGGMSRGSYANAFAGGTPIASLVRELGASMPGVEIGNIKVTGNLPPKGLQLSGSSTSQLNKLADQFGFSWSVQNGVLQAIMDGKDSGEAFSFDSDTNLMGISPVINGPLQVPIGVEISAKFEARVRPGDRCVVRSKINPELSGAYTATSVTLAFDSHGPASTKIQSLKVF